MVSVPSFNKIICGCWKFEKMKTIIIYEEMKSLIMVKQIFLIKIYSLAAFCCKIGYIDKINGQKNGKRKIL